jgi:hypothetical protein
VAIRRELAEFDTIGVIYDEVHGLNVGDDVPREV